MSSRIRTVIFLSESEGPVNRTSFRLNVSPDSKRKKTKISTIIASPMNPNAPMEPAITKSPSFNLG